MGRVFAPRRETFSLHCSAKDVQNGVRSVLRQKAWLACRQKAFAVCTLLLLCLWSLPAIGKVLAQTIHHEVDSATMCVASKASVGVGASVECQAGVMIVMEWTEALVTSDAESEALSHCLYGQLAELLYCGFIEHDYLFLVILSDVTP